MPVPDASASRWPRAPAAHGPIDVDGHVAQLASQAVRAAQQSAVADNRAADAGRDGQVDVVRQAARRPKGTLTKGRDLGVALEQRRQSKLFTEARREREAPQTGIEVGRVEEDAPARVERARR